MEDRTFNFFFNTIFAIVIIGIVAQGAFYVWAAVTTANAVSAECKGKDAISCAGNAVGKFKRAYDAVSSEAE